MNKTVRKLRATDYWRIGEHESWFSHMAAKGLHLKKIGFYFAHFKKAEPKNMRYRIEVSKEKFLEEEQLEVYKQSGWDYVTSYNVYHVGYHVFHVFSSPEERNAPELHTDPAEQSYSLKELNENLWLSASISVVSMLLMLGMVLSIWFLDGTPTYVLVEGFGIQTIVLTMFAAYLSFTSLQSAISIRSLKNRLLEGKPINHQAPWKKQFRLNKTIFSFFTFALLLGSSHSLMQLMKDETKTLPETSESLPIVRLADIEQHPDFIRSEQEVIDDVDWGNHYSYQWSIVAPIQFEAFENGFIPDEVWADGSKDYTPSIQTEFYQLTFSSMAEPLIFDLMKWYNINKKDSIVKIENGLDYLVVEETEYFKTIIASKGKNVIVIRYDGNANINRLIDQVIEKIQLIPQ